MVHRAAAYLPTYLPLHCLLLSQACCKRALCMWQWACEDKSIYPAKILRLLAHNRGVSLMQTR